MRFIPPIAVTLLTVWFTRSFAFAEEAIPLADILKPSVEGTSTATGEINTSMILFNTLLVIGLGLWVMRQRWFVEWAERVRVAHTEGAQPILMAMGQALRLPRFKAPSVGSLQSHFLTKAPERPSNAPPPAWLERVDVQTLETGTKLHWLRVHGQDYILTETANHSQWLKLGEDGDAEESIPAVEGGASVAKEQASPVYQLPDYLDSL
jgi:hypothetical protein